MKKRVLAVLVALPWRPSSRRSAPGNAASTRRAGASGLSCRMSTSMKASLETSGYDVLETNSADSSSSWW